MNEIQQWGATVCCAAIAAGILNMVSPGASMERIFRIVIGLFFVCSILSPLKNFDSIITHQWPANENKQQLMTENYGNAADEIFNKTATQMLQGLTQKKLEDMGIKDGVVSVYINETTNEKLIAEDIIIEVELKKEQAHRHDEIVKYLKYELGTTIRIGYIN